MSPTLRARLQEAVRAAQEAGKISEVAERVGCARTTVYRALQDPDAVRLGTADEIIEATRAILKELRAAEQPNKRSGGPSGSS